MMITFEKMFGCEPEFPEKFTKMANGQSYESALSELSVGNGDITLFNTEDEEVAFTFGQYLFEKMNGEWVMTYGFIGNCPVYLTEDGMYDAE